MGIGVKLINLIVQVDINPTTTIQSCPQRVFWRWISGILFNLDVKLSLIFLDFVHFILIVFVVEPEGKMSEPCLRAGMSLINGKRDEKKE